MAAAVRRIAPLASRSDVKSESDMLRETCYARDVLSQSQSLSLSVARCRSLKRTVLEAGASFGSRCCLCLDLT